MTNHVRSYTNTEIRDLLNRVDPADLIAICQDHFLGLNKKLGLARGLRKDETINTVMEYFICRSFVPLLNAIKVQDSDLYAEWEASLSRNRDGPPPIKKIIWLRILVCVLLGGVVGVAIILGWQANIERVLILGGYLILVSLVSLLLFRGKGDREKGIIKRIKHIKILIKIVKDKNWRCLLSKRYHKTLLLLLHRYKTRIVLLGIAALGLLLIISGLALRWNFKSCEEKCLSVVVSPCLMLNVPMEADSTIIGTMMCPPPGSTIISLPRGQVGSLANLSGQPILTGSTNDCKCNWRVDVNNTPLAPIASIEPCAFSVPLPTQVTYIHLQLEIGGATEPFDMWGLTAQSQTRIFNIQVK